jgi:hypothetical protein
MPDKWTFRIPPIADLLARYVGDGKGWIDPFAGETSPAEITNDLNPERPATYHMDATDFIKQLPGQYKGLLFDPPYSLRQIKECYDSVGKTVTGLELNFGEFQQQIEHVIEQGGTAISFGWNLIGMGKTHGFEIIEILLVCHGRAHNDTIVTVERKVQANFKTAT